MEGLAKRFGDVVALEGIDFQVPAGTVFGLLGPNGAGKTTAIRILTTILALTGRRAEAETAANGAQRGRKGAGARGAA